ncbi:hypothetical protein PHJA_000236800 [Phtheirospermum japonicum]|uniref:Uncharacterized protein n=1 Tax=Phtheirospermum japonicum TaxID=374723 RepID=A0A830BA74_9LAMI|nr:hypothetical protein PHJA_000236800 [Phtheirospermum japonicum]
MMMNEDVKLSMEDDKLIKAEGSGSNERVLRWNLRDRKSMQLSKAKQQQALAEKEDLPKLPSFSLELNAGEIAEDLFAVMGKLPSRRTDKRDKNVQKQIDLIYPGGYLETITVDRYNVSRSNRKRKIVVSGMPEKTRSNNKSTEKKRKRGGEEERKLSIRIELTKEEIEKDIFALTGSKPTSEA